MTQEAQQVVTPLAALKLALEYIQAVPDDRYNAEHIDRDALITVIEKALAKEKALQALHNENERLGLYKDAYAQPEEEKLHPVHIGVDVTREGTAVTAFYRKPDAVMEMFYSQFHPMAQPEHDYRTRYDRGCYKCGSHYCPADCPEPLHLVPQRTWVGLTDEDIDQGLLRSNHVLQTAVAWRDGVEWAIKQLKEKNT